MEKRSDVTRRNKCPTRNVLISNTPFSRNYIVYPPMHNKIPKKRKLRTLAIFFDTGKLVERKKNDTVPPNTRRQVVLKYWPWWHKRKKPAGITTRLIEMRITRKNDTNRSWKGERNERAARDVLLIGLCTQALFTSPSSLWERQKEWKRKREKREKEIIKRGWICVPISRIFRGTYDLYM